MLVNKIHVQKTLDKIYLGQKVLGTKKLWPQKCCSKIKHFNGGKLLKIILHKCFQQYFYLTEVIRHQTQHFRIYKIDLPTSKHIEFYYASLFSIKMVYSNYNFHLWLWEGASLYPTVVTTFTTTATTTTTTTPVPVSLIDASRASFRHTDATLGCEPHSPSQHSPTPPTPHPRPRLPTRLWTTPPAYLAPAQPQRANYAIMGARPRTATNGASGSSLARRTLTSPSPPRRTPQPPRPTSQHYQRSSPARCPAQLFWWCRDNISCGRANGLHLNNCGFCG